MDIRDRIETTRVALHLHHGEMARELGISRAMYYCIKNGEKPIGNKAFRELERLEAVSGGFRDGESRIMDAASLSEQYGTPSEKQLAFELELTRKHLEIANKNAAAGERKLALLKKKLSKLLEILGD